MAETVASSAPIAGEQGDDDEAKYNENEKAEVGKVFGIIPQEIKGDFGCIGCKAVRCMYQS